jgi:hypothetical protein
VIIDRYHRKEENKWRAFQKNRMLTKVCILFLEMHSVSWNASQTMEEKNLFGNMCPPITLKKSERVFITEWEEVGIPSKEWEGGISMCLLIPLLRSRHYEASPLYTSWSTYVWFMTMFVLWDVATQRVSNWRGETGPNINCSLLYVLTSWSSLAASVSLNMQLFWQS